MSDARNLQHAAPQGPTLEAARLRFDNAACIIAEESTWPGTSSDLIQIRRADYNELRAALENLRAVLGVR